MIKDESICHFVPVETFWDEAQNVFQDEKNILFKLLDEFSIKIEQYGGSSIPGSLTKRDIDIQIRVEEKDFQDIVKIINNYAEGKRRDIWTDKLALFKNDKQFPLDYVITINGSEEELYYFGARDLLLGDHILLEEYNELKKSFEGKSYGNYRIAKKLFWQRILKEKLGLSRVD